MSNLWPDASIIILCMQHNIQLCFTFQVMTLVTPSQRWRTYPSFTELCGSVTWTRWKLQPRGSSQMIWTPLTRDAGETSNKVCKVLLKSLSSLSSFHSRTALHLACSKAHKEIIIHLCSLNANVNLQDGDGATPMHKVRTGVVPLTHCSLCICMNKH